VGSGGREHWTVHFVQGRTQPVVLPTAHLALEERSPFFLTPLVLLLALYYLHGEGCGLCCRTQQV
jgi:hypothetical protein